MISIKNDRTATILKMVAIGSFTFLFASVYWGSNALYFLSQEIQTFIRVTSLIIGAVSLIGFLLLKHDIDSSLVEVGSRKYYKEALEALEHSMLSAETIEKIIANGSSKKISKTNTQYSWTDENGIKILVYVDAKGSVMEVVS